MLYGIASYMSLTGYVKLFFDILNNSSKKLIVFCDSVDMEVTIHTSTGSVQLVVGTQTCAGDKKKLESVITPAKMASGGTLSALPICPQPLK